MLEWRYKYRCGCKGLINKGSCEKGFIWNPSNCECECDKSCEINEYLDYQNCKCRKKLADKLIEECTKNIDEKEIYPAKLHLEETISPVCSSCKICIILFSLFFTINIRVGTVFIYFHWLKKPIFKPFETTIYWIYKDGKSNKCQKQKLLFF